MDKEYRDPYLVPITSVKKETESEIKQNYPADDDYDIKNKPSIIGDVKINDTKEYSKCIRKKRTVDPVLENFLLSSLFDTFLGSSVILSKKSVMFLARQFSIKINNESTEELTKKFNYNWAVSFFKRNEKKFQEWSSLPYTKYDINNQKSPR